MHVKHSRRESLGSSLVRSNYGEDRRYNSLSGHLRANADLFSSVSLRSICSALDNHSTTESGRLYADPEQIHRMFCGTIFKKLDLPFEGEMPDTYSPALQKFLECEDQCKATNEVIRQGFTHKRLHLLYVARRIVKEILGPIPSGSDIAKVAEHGPGAVFFSSVDTSLPYKYGTIPYSVTPDFPDSLLYSLFCENRQWRRALIRKTKLRRFDSLQEFYMSFKANCLELVSGNRFTTVPKTAVIDRPICVEPTINMLAQKGLGAIMRQRLKQNSRGRTFVGCIDLRSQQALHKEIIQESFEEIGTIDLSSASDTISVELVRSLLPPSWFRLLDGTRSRWTTVGQQEGSFSFKNEKFSSMGNGFTFELETIVFYALALATYEVLRVTPKYLSVYGDDIIVDRSLFADLMETLQGFGFTPNTEKSFCNADPVRESCGANVFRIPSGYLLMPLPSIKSLNSYASLCQANNTLSIVSRECRDIVPLVSSECLKLIRHLDPLLSESNLSKGIAGCGLLSIFDPFDWDRVATFGYRFVPKKFSDDLPDFSLITAIRVCEYPERTARRRGTWKRFSSLVPRYEYVTSYRLVAVGPPQRLIRSAGNRLPGRSEIAWCISEARKGLGCTVR